MTESKTSVPHSANEFVRTQAERLALEQHERAQRRLQELAEQQSDLNPPGVRIRVWEKVHALRLPVDPGHPVLRVVAIGTGLTLAEVQEEQRARVTPRTAGSHLGEPGGKG
ncbi:MAG: hypothetical protein WBE65_06170 [Steroidobacteraceae bacterium]